MTGVPGEDERGETVIGLVGQKAADVLARGLVGVPDREPTLKVGGSVTRGAGRFVATFEPRTFGFTTGSGPDSL